MYLLKWPVRAFMKHLHFSLWFVSFYGETAEEMVKVCTVACLAGCKTEEWNWSSWDSEDPPPSEITSSRGEKSVCWCQVSVCRNCRLQGHRVVKAELKAAAKEPESFISLVLSLLWCEEAFSLQMKLLHLFSRFEIFAIFWDSWEQLISKVHDRKPSSWGFSPF